jgi:hypothetical protein
MKVSGPSEVDSLLLHPAEPGPHFSKTTLPMLIVLQDFQLKVEI